jgi:Tfp pilus assembly protein PilF
LAQGERIDPNFEMTYVYRGNVFEATGDKAAAAAQYQRALALNPLNSVARDALARVSR